MINPEPPDGYYTDEEARVIDELLYEAAQAAATAERTEAAA